MRISVNFNPLITAFRNLPDTRLGFTVPTFLFARTGAYGLGIQVEFNVGVEVSAGLEAQGWTIRVNGGSVAFSFYKNDPEKRAVTFLLAARLYVTDVVTISYDASVGEYVGVDGDYPLGSFTDQPVDNNSAAVLPQYVDGTVDADGRTVFLQFNQDMYTLDGTGFEFSVNGTPVPFLFEGYGELVEFLLNVPVDVNDLVTVQYDGTGDLQAEFTGDSMPAFGPDTLTNESQQTYPTFDSFRSVVQANGYSILLYASRPTQSDPGEETLGLEYKIDGVPTEITYVGVSALNDFVGDEVALPGQEVTLSYTGIGSYRAVDNGMVLRPFTDTPFNNESQVSDPTFINADLAADGATLTLHFNTAITAIPGTELDGLLVTVVGLEHAITFSSFSGNDMIIVLPDPPAAVGNGVTVMYDGSGTLRTVVGDIPVSAFGPAGVINNSVQTYPTFDAANSSVGADGVTLTFAYSRPVTATSGTETQGLTYRAAGSAIPLSYSGGYVGTEAALQGEITDLAYSGGGTLRAVDNSMAVRSFSATSFPNNSTIVVPTMTASAIDATGLLLDMTFSEPIFATPGQEVQGFTFVVNGLTRTITFDSFPAANVMRANIAATVAQGEVATLAYGAGTLENGAGVPVDNFIATPVTNNSTMTRPVVNTAAVDATGLVLDITFNQNVSATGGQEVAGFTLIVTGQGARPITFDSFPAANVLRADISTVVRIGDTLTLSYDDATGTIRGDGNLAMADFSAMAVTNNSTVQSYSAEAEAVFALMPDQAALTTAVKDAMAAFIDSQVANGNWAKLGCFMCATVSGGLLTSQANALTDWKSGDSGSLVNGATWNGTDGFLFSATSQYANTPCAPSDPPAAQNDALYGACIGNIFVGTNVNILGASSGGVHSRLMSTSGNTINAASVNASTLVTVNDPYGAGDVVSVGRTAANAWAVYIDGSQVFFDSTVSGVPGSASFHLNGFNNGGTHNIGGTGSLRAFFHGAAVGFDHSAFSSALATLCN